MPISSRRMEFNKVFPELEDNYYLGRINALLG